MSKKRGKTSDGVKSTKKGATGSQIQIADSKKSQGAPWFEIGQIVDIQQESRGKWKRGKIIHVRASTSRKHQNVLYDVSYDGGQMECEIDADRIRSQTKQTAVSPFSTRPPATADILEFTKTAEAKHAAKTKRTSGGSLDGYMDTRAADQGIVPSAATARNMTGAFGDDDRDGSDAMLFKSEDQVLAHQGEIQRVLDDLFSIHADVHCVKKALSALLKLLRLAPQVTADYFHFKAGETILLHIIRSHQLYSVLQCYGFVLVRKMCHLSLDSCGVFVQNGAIPAIGNALRAFPSDPIIQASGCGALAALGQLSTAALQVMLEHDIVPTITTAVTTHHDINNHTRQVQFYASEVLLELCDRGGTAVAATIVDPADDYATIRTLLHVLRKSLKLDDKKVSCAICTLLLCLLSLNKSIAQVLRQIDGITDLSIVMAKYPAHEGILKYSLVATRELAVSSMQNSPSSKVRQTARIILEEEPLKRQKPASPASTRKKSKTSQQAAQKNVLPSPSRGAVKKESTIAAREKLLLQTYGFDPCAVTTNTARSSKSRQGTSPRKKSSVSKPGTPTATAAVEREPPPELLRPSSSKLLPLAITDPPAVRPATTAPQPTKKDKLDSLVCPSPLAELKSFATELFEAVNDPSTPLNRVSFADKLHRMIEKAETALDPVHFAPPTTDMPPPASARFQSKPPPVIDTSVDVLGENGIFSPLSHKLPALNVGTQVKCRFNGGGRYYAGVITRCSDNNQTFDVDYADGEQETDVPLDYIRVCDTPTSSVTKPTTPALFAAGDIVEVRYKGKSKYYPGVISRVGADNQYEINYDDGECETDVAQDLIQLIKKKPQSPISSMGWKIGQKVEARYKRRQKYYKGMIARIRSNGTYDVEYDDGEREASVDKEMIRIIAEVVESPQFEEGDTIEAQYDGKQRFYPGVITRCRLDGSYDIKYEDGDTETFVAPELIRKRKPMPIHYAVDNRVEVVKGPKSMVGTITKASSNGMYSVLYDNGDKDKVSVEHIRGIAKDEVFERHQRIEARPPTTFVYSLGLITNCRFNGTYDIEFESGEVATGVAPSLIRSLPWPTNEPEYYPLWHVGDIVEARFEGKSKYLPGVIARVAIQGQSALYEIHFENGEIESRVPEDSIHLLHRSLEIPVFAAGDRVTKQGKVAAIMRCHIDGTYDLKYSNGSTETKVSKDGLIRAIDDGVVYGEAGRFDAASDNNTEAPSWFHDPCQATTKQEALSTTVSQNNLVITGDPPLVNFESSDENRGPSVEEIAGTIEQENPRHKQRQVLSTRGNALYDEAEIADVIDDPTYVGGNDPPIKLERDESILRTGLALCDNTINEMPKYDDRIPESTISQEVHIEHGEKNRIAPNLSLADAEIPTGLLNDNEGSQPAEPNLGDWSKDIHSIDDAKETIQVNSEDFKNDASYMRTEGKSEAHTDNEANEKPSYGIETPHLGAHDFESKGEDSYMAKSAAPIESPVWNIADEAKEESMDTTVQYVEPSDDKTPDEPTYENDQTEDFATQIVFDDFKEAEDYSMPSCVDDSIDESRELPQSQFIEIPQSSTSAPFSHSTKTASTAATTEAEQIAFDDTNISNEGQDDVLVMATTTEDAASYLMSESTESTGGQPHLDVNVHTSTGDNNLTDESRSDHFADTGIVRRDEDPFAHALSICSVAEDFVNDTINSVTHALQARALILVVEGTVKHIIDSTIHTYRESTSNAVEDNCLALLVTGNSHLVQLEGAHNETQKRISQEDQIREDPESRAEDDYRISNDNHVMDDYQGIYGHEEATSEALDKNQFNFTLIAIENIVSSIVTDGLILAQGSILRSTKHYEGQVEGIYHVVMDDTSAATDENIANTAATDCVTPIPELEHSEAFETPTTQALSFESIPVGSLHDLPSKDIFSMATQFIETIIAQGLLLAVAQVIAANNVSFEVGWGDESPLEMPSGDGNDFHKNGAEHLTTVEDSIFEPTSHIVPADVADISSKPYQDIEYEGDLIDDLFAPTAQPDPPKSPVPPLRLLSVHSLPFLPAKEEVYAFTTGFVKHIISQGIENYLSTITAGREQVISTEQCDEQLQLSMDTAISTNQGDNDSDDGYYNDFVPQYTRAMVPPLRASTVRSFPNMPPKDKAAACALELVDAVIPEGILRAKASLAMLESAEKCAGKNLVDTTAATFASLNDENTQDDAQNCAEATVQNDTNMVHFSMFVNTTVGDIIQSTVKRVSTARIVPPATIAPEDPDLSSTIFPMEEDTPPNTDLITMPTEFISCVQDDDQEIANSQGYGVEEDNASFSKLTEVHHQSNNALPLKVDRSMEELHGYRFSNVDSTRLMAIARIAKSFVMKCMYFNFEQIASRQAEPNAIPSAANIMPPMGHLVDMDLEEPLRDESTPKAIEPNLQIGSPKIEGDESEEIEHDGVRAFVVSQLAKSFVLHCMYDRFETIAAQQVRSVAPFEEATLEVLQVDAAQIALAPHSPPTEIALDVTMVPSEVEIALEAKSFVTHCVYEQFEEIAAEQTHPPPYSANLDTDATLEYEQSSLVGTVPTTPSEIDIARTAKSFVTKCLYDHFEQIASDQSPSAHDESLDFVEKSSTDTTLDQFVAPVEKCNSFAGSNADDTNDAPDEVAIAIQAKKFVTKCLYDQFEQFAFQTAPMNHSTATQPDVSFSAHENTQNSMDTSMMPPISNHDIAEFIQDMNDDIEQDVEAQVVNVVSQIAEVLTSRSITQGLHQAVHVTLARDNQLSTTNPEEELTTTDAEQNQCALDRDDAIDHGGNYISNEKSSQKFDRVDDHISLTGNFDDKSKYAKATEFESLMTDVGNQFQQEPMLVAAASIEHEISRETRNVENKMSLKVVASDDVTSAIDSAVALVVEKLVHSSANQVCIGSEVELSDMERNADGGYLSWGDETTTPETKEPFEDAKTIGNYFNGESKSEQAFENTTDPSINAHAYEEEVAKYDDGAEFDSGSEPKPENPPEDNYSGEKEYKLDDEFEASKELTAKNMQDREETDYNNEFEDESSGPTNFASEHSYETTKEAGEDVAEAKGLASSRSVESDTAKYSGEDDFEDSSKSDGAKPVFSNETMTDQSSVQVPAKYLDDEDIANQYESEFLEIEQPTNDENISPNETSKQANEVEIYSNEDDFEPAAGVPVPHDPLFGLVVPIAVADEIERKINSDGVLGITQLQGQSTSTDRSGDYFDEVASSQDSQLKVFYDESKSNPTNETASMESVSGYTVENIQEYSSTDDYADPTEFANVDKLQRIRVAAAEFADSIALAETEPTSEPTSVTGVSLAHSPVDIPQNADDVSLYAESPDFELPMEDEGRQHISPKWTDKELSVQGEFGVSEDSSHPAVPAELTTQTSSEDVDPYALDKVFDAEESPRVPSTNVEPSGVFDPSTEISQPATTDTLSDVLRDGNPDVEQYSLDEGFVDVDGDHAQHPGDAHELATEKEASHRSDSEGAYQRAAPSGTELSVFAAEALTDDAKEAEVAAWENGIKSAVAVEYCIPSSSEQVVKDMTTTSESSVEMTPPAPANSIEFHGEVLNEQYEYDTTAEQVVETPQYATVPTLMEPSDGIIDTVIRMETDGSKNLSEASSANDNNAWIQFHEGERVDVRYRGRSHYFSAVISRTRPNGKYDIDYDDGDREHEVSPEFIRSKDTTTELFAEEVVSTHNEATTWVAEATRATEATSVESPIKDVVEHVTDSDVAPVEAGEVHIEAPDMTGSVIAEAVSDTTTSAKIVALDGSVNTLGVVNVAGESSAEFDAPHGETMAEPPEVQCREVADSDVESLFEHNTSVDVEPASRVATEAEFAMERVVSGDTKSLPFAPPTSTALNNGSNAEGGLFVMEPEVIVLEANAMNNGLSVNEPVLSPTDDVSLIGSHAESKFDVVSDESLQYLENNEFEDTANSVDSKQTYLDTVDVLYNDEGDFDIPGDSPTPVEQVALTTQTLTDDADAYALDEEFDTEGTPRGLDTKPDVSTTGISPIDTPNVSSNTLSDGDPDVDQYSMDNGFVDVDAEAQQYPGVANGLASLSNAVEHETTAESGIETMDIGREHVVVDSVRANYDDGNEFEQPNTEDARVPTQDDLFKTSATTNDMKDIAQTILSLSTDDADTGDYIENAQFDIECTDIASENKYQMARDSGEVNTSMEQTVDLYSLDNDFEGPDDGGENLPSHSNQAAIDDEVASYSRNDDFDNALPNTTTQTSPSTTFNPSETDSIVTTTMAVEIPDLSLSLAPQEVPPPIKLSPPKQHVRFDDFEDLEEEEIRAPSDDTPPHIPTQTTNTLPVRYTHEEASITPESATMEAPAVTVLKFHTVENDMTTSTEDNAKPNSTSIAATHAMEGKIIHSVESASSKLLNESPTINSVIKFDEGDKAEVLYRKQANYLSGTISRCRSDGTYDVEYDDGDKEHQVTPNFIRSKQITSQLAQLDNNNCTTAKYIPGETSAQHEVKTVYEAIDVATDQATDKAPIADVEEHAAAPVVAHVEAVAAPVEAEPVVAADHEVASHAVDAVSEPTVAATEHAAVEAPVAAVEEHAAAPVVTHVEAVAAPVEAEPVEATDHEFASHAVDAVSEPTVAAAEHAAVEAPLAAVEEHAAAPVVAHAEAVAAPVEAEPVVAADHEVASHAVDAVSEPTVAAAE
ncbi:hypothetical protein As57867_001761, partial [Aphanomyces stellatus]